MDVFVARQAIFDRARNVYGYELLFRSEPSRNEFDAAQGGDPTTQVVANSLFSIGLENMLGGKKAFVNFDRASLAGGIHSILPCDSTVVELLETVEPDEEVIALCSELRQQGYLIALDDFVNHPRFEALTELARMIKVDMRSTEKEEQKRLLETYKPRGIAMLAEKVETQEEFEWARNAGYDLFQGYFFARPVVTRAQEVPAVKLTCLHLLSETQHPDFDLKRLESIIRQDVSLSFKLFRFANSARFQRSAAIRSIGHALAILGEDGIRHWAVLAALPVLAQDKPGELITVSLVRARFCELLARSQNGVDPNAAFLAGLFSLLDALIDMPMESALRRLKILPEVSAVLLQNSTEQDRLGQLYQLILAYEAGEWERVEGLAASLGLPGGAVLRAYSQAVFWTHQALHDTKRTKDARRRLRYVAQGTLRILWTDPQNRERLAVAKLLNVSVQGLQLQLEERILPRTLVYCNEIKLGLSGHGVVRYCQPSKGKYIMGLEFPNGTGWREPVS